MPLRQRTKTRRKTICGKGFCECKSKQFVHGKGFMDIIQALKNVVTPAINMINENKDVLKSGVEAVGNVVKIGDSTRTIVQEIMKKRKQKVEKEEVATDGLQNIVNKINQFKMGSGFQYV